MYQKKKKHLGLMSVFLSFILLLSVINLPVLKVEAESPIDEFIYRCYDVALGREPDPDGLVNWRSDLSNNIRCGSDAEYCFVFGTEYTAKDKTNEEFVTDMYHIFLGRDPEPDGMAHWMSLIAQGQTREQIFAGFANSEEFFSLCYNYGITAGYFDANYDRNQLNKVNLFVARLYDICLNRIGDQNGQINWASSLLSGRHTGAEVAHEFIFSKEYQSLNLSDGAYVRNLYLALMGRQYDVGGYENWVKALESGYSRDEVFAQFVMSEEFGNICADYGINRGSYTPTDIGNRKLSAKYRIIKKKYSNGDYVEYIYDNAISSYAPNVKRFDSNGNFKEYESYEEVTKTANGTESKYYYTGFDGNGEISWQSFSKIVVSADELSETDYFYSDDWKTITDYYVYENIMTTTYNADGSTTTWAQPKKVYVYDSSDSLWSTSYYEYDSYYRCTSIERFRYDGTKLGATYIEHYNNNPYLIGDVKSYTEFEYDESGNESFRSVSEYDGRDNEVKHSEYDHGKLVINTISEYDAKGRNTKEICYDGDGKITRTKIFKYDTRGNLIERTQYASDNSVEDKGTFTYDDKNHVILEKYVSADGSRTEYAYEYDQYGNQTKLICTYNNGKVDWEENWYEAY